MLVFYVILAVLVDHVDCLTANCTGNTYETVGPYGHAMCKACSKCPPGTYVSRECEGQLDTECKNCSEGTYSKSWSRSTICRTCTHCPPHLKRVEDCTKKQNAKCAANCDHGYFLDELTDLCTSCSSCASDDPNYTPPRVRECIQQGMPKDQQCVPTKHAGNFAIHRLWVKQPKTTAKSIDDNFVTVNDIPPSHLASVIDETTDHDTVNNNLTIIITCISIIVVSVVMVVIACRYRHKEFDKKASDNEKMIVPVVANEDNDCNILMNVYGNRGHMETVPLQATVQDSPC